jgi:hypothetical protein
MAFFKNADGRRRNAAGFGNQNTKVVQKKTGDEARLSNGATPRASGEFSVRFVCGCRRKIELKMGTKNLVPVAAWGSLTKFKKSTKKASKKPRNLKAVGYWQQYTIHSKVSHNVSERCQTPSTDRHMLPEPSDPSSLVSGALPGSTSGDTFALFCVQQPKSSSNLHSDPQPPGGCASLCSLVLANFWSNAHIHRASLMLLISCDHRRPIWLARMGGSCC